MAGNGERPDRWIERPDIWSGAVLAGVAAVESFKPSLMPRSAREQAIVTGTSMVAGWAVANSVYGLVAGRGSAEDDLRGLSMAAAVGLAVRTALSPTANEPPRRAAIRTGASLFSAGALASAAAVTVGEWRGRYAVVPVAAGLAVAAGVRSVRQSVKAQRERRGPYDPRTPRPVPTTLGAIGVAGGMGAVIQGYRLSGRGLYRVMNRRLRTPDRVDALASRIMAVGLWAGGVVGLYRAFSGGVALYDRVLDPGYDRPPDTPERSGGPGSLLSFARIGRHGRRFVTDVASAEDIRSVMGVEPVAEPVRVFVGFDSGRTITDRVTLAVAELERTGAFDRKLLIVNSPPGNGQCNSVPIETAELLLAGDVASVSVQYDRMPSLMAVQNTTLGAHCHRTLLAAIQAALEDRPADRRPTVVVYGESLGAWAGQDAFLHGGISALDSLGVARALWVGTPYYSGWRHQALGLGHVPPGTVIEVAGPDELDALAPERLARLRVVLLTHLDDPVNRLSAALIIQQPPWLAEQRPPQVPRNMRFTAIITALQTIVDGVNATNPVPGVFAAVGHDYRADLPRVVAKAYALPDPGPEGWTRIYDHLQAVEAARASMFRRPVLDSISQSLPPAVQSLLSSDGDGETVGPVPRAPDDAAQLAGLPAGDTPQGTVEPAGPAEAGPGDRDSEPVATGAPGEDGRAEVSTGPSQPRRRSWRRVRGRRSRLRR